MKQFSLVALTVSIASNFSFSQTPLLVSTDWVAEHSKDPNIVFIQVSSNRREFENGHIPGARFLWWQYLSPSNPDESTGLPPPDQAKNTLEEIGISNGARVVLYGGPGVITLLTRMFLMFEYLGLGESTSIMSGGMDAWKAEKREVATGPAAKVNRGTFVIKQKPSVIVDADWVKSNLKNSSVTIVDARAKQFYDGTPGSPQRSGHIAGARNVTFSNMVDSLNRFKSLDSLKKYFSAASVDPSSKIVTYCFVGQQATTTYFAARLLGYDAAVFDGSWDVWSTLDDSYPVEQTILPKPASK